MSAHWQSSGASVLGPVERQARARVFATARRHSWLVRLLRVFLPLAGAVAVVGLIAVTHLRLPANLDLSAARLSVTSNAIIMDRPHLTGFDRDKREYSVAAERAVQPLASPDQVALEAIDAKVTVPGQGAATVKADIGDYDHSARTLRLRGDIAIDTTEGYALRMTDADIDFTAGTMVSDNAVRATYKGSEISGERIIVEEGGNIIVFEGKVETTIMPPKRQPQAAVKTAPPVTTEGPPIRGQPMGEALDQTQ